MSELSGAVTSGFGDDCLLFIALNMLNDPPNTGAEHLWFLSTKDKAEAQRQENGESRGEEWMHAQSSKTQEQRLEESAAEAKRMVDPLKRIVLETKEEIFPIFLREVKLEKIPSGRVTLLGDAAHAMSICGYKSTIPVTSFLINF